MSQPHLHSFYRIWFTTVDPTVLFFTVLTCIFSPDTIFVTTFPPSIETYDPMTHGPLLHQAAALYGFLGIIFAVVLRVSPDPRVWRIVQAAVLGVDVSLLATMFNILRLQDRINVGAWRGGDWFNILFTVWVALIRVAYLLGVGGDNDTAKKVR